jgi:SAM-dependent methyltransferase
MFFPEKIKSIRSSDRVLEIGPGALPHPRSDVFLDLVHSDEQQARKQRGNSEAISLAKPIVYYEGGEFPFADKEFNYVICSHVIEHVPDVETFLAEMFRVASTGYLEYPTIYYEYLYNFDVHLNVLKWHDGWLTYLKKKDAGLDAFLPVQKLFYQSLEKQYFQLVNALQPYMFEGFEWLSPFPTSRTQQIEDVVFPEVSLLKYSDPPRHPVIRVINRLRRLRKAIAR